MTNTKKHLRPLKLKLNIDEIVEFTYSEPLKDSLTNKLVDFKIMPTLIITKKNGTDKPTLPIVAEMFSNERVQQFNYLTYFIGKLIRISELNCDNLRVYVKKYFKKVDFIEFCDRNKKCSECKNYNISKDFKLLTFGQLRNILSCILKSDKCLKLEQFNSPELLKEFTVLYHNYIYDRDCYTHGKLFFLYPEYIPILKVNPPYPPY